MKKRSYLAAIVLFSASVQSQDSVITAREAVDMAVEQNLRVKIVRSDRDIADINNNWGNAGRWPTVTAGVSNTEALTNLNQVLANGSEINRNGVTNNNLNANLNFNWRI
jgi:hypothetical protein